MTRRSFTALLIASAGMLLVPAAHACSCGDPGPPCIAFNETPVVFAGRVIQLTELRIPVGRDKTLHPYHLVRFDVEETFRGPQRKLLDVTTGAGGGDCGFSFRTGERYLVYAHASPEIGRLYTDFCTRTKPLSEAGADLDFLRRRGDPSRGAGLEGTILELARDPKTNNTSTRGMMQGVRVVVEGNGKSWDAKTDNNGWFRVWGLPGGEYTVRAVLPKNFVPEATTRKVRITRAACGWVHMLATPFAFPQPKQP